MKNPKTGGNWEEDKEPVEIYDVAQRKMWEEWKKVPPLPWEDNMSH